VAVAEGDRVAAGALVARLDTADSELALRRAEADRDQAVAALRLLQAGARAEDIRQARAQESSAQADIAAAESELEAANADLQRFDALLKSNAGSRKQRDDAATRRDIERARVQRKSPVPGRASLRRMRRLRCFART
jgi:HlyD family secretion protein